MHLLVISGKCNGCIAITLDSATALRSLLILTLCWLPGGIIAGDVR